LFENTALIACKPGPSLAKLNVIFKPESSYAMNCGFCTCYCWGIKLWPNMSPPSGVDWVVGPDPNPPRRSSSPPRRLPLPWLKAF
jgi:hypothetical protein